MKIHKYLIALLLLLIALPAGAVDFEAGSAASFTDTISVDHVNEYTLNHGVAVDGVLLKDGTITGVSAPVQVGSVISTHSVTSTSALLISNSIEVDGASYFDGATSHQNSVSLVQTGTASVGDPVKNSNVFILTSGGWDTDDATNRYADWKIENVPTSANTVYSKLSLQHQLAGGGYGEVYGLGSNTFSFIPNAGSGLTASTEAVSVLWDLSATKTWLAGNIASQVDYKIKPATYAFSGGGAQIQAGITFDVAGGPIAGSNSALIYSIPFTVGWNGGAGWFSNAGTAISQMIFYPNIANDVGTATGVAGLMITNVGSSVSLGNQTATLDDFTGVHISAPELTSTTNTRTVTDARTLYISGAPTAGANVTFTNTAYALNVNSGMNRLAGGLQLGTSLSLTTRGQPFYRTMKNNSGGALSAGHVVILDTTDNSGQSVTTTTVANNALAFGVVTTGGADQADVVVGVGGAVGDVVKVDGTTDIAVGDPLSTFTAAGIAQKGSYGTGAIFAIALEAYSTDDSSGVIRAWIF